jgi:hypothetical protein
VIVNARIHVGKHIVDERLHVVAKNECMQNQVRNQHFLHIFDFLLNRKNQYTKNTCLNKLSKDTAFKHSITSKFDCICVFSTCSRQLWCSRNCRIVLCGRYLIHENIKLLTYTCLNSRKLE